MSIAKDGAESIKILWRIDQWFPDLAPDLRLRLKKYHEELLNQNKSLNLIGVKTIPMADAIHFADSILASRVISQDLKTKEVYDFGSGNGFPGIVFAMLLPQIKFYLVDADKRKCEFLVHVASLLGLKNVEVLNKNVESFPEGSIQTAISRGFAPISKSILLTRKIFPVGGVYYHLKGEEWASEIADIPTQLCSFWQPSLLGEYRLPVGEVKFAIVKTEKIEK